MPLRPPRVRINRVEIEGFKSIRNASLDLSSVNLLIGANGAGKSNFASFFAMTSASLNGSLSGYVDPHGGARSFLHQGAKFTDQIYWKWDVSTEGGDGSVVQLLSFKAPDALIYSTHHSKVEHSIDLQTTIFDDVCAIRTERSRLHNRRIFNGLKDGIGTYHFQDTSINGPLRGPADVSETLRLDGDGKNLPAILHYYEEAEKSSKSSSKSKPSSQAFTRITRTVRKFFPGFDRFVLVPEADDRRILLRWRHRDSDQVYGPHQLSDGTLRAIALITLLLQPKEDLPNLIVINEPELGLHPVGIELIAELIQAVSLHCQVIVSTQSTVMLDCFEPEQVVVVDAEKGSSTFRRLDRRELARWLKSYTISDLWRKNVVGGSPLP